MDEEDDDRVCPTPEQTFYASFKIYLSDSRKNSVCEVDEGEINDEINEVVSRIEKTMELSDDCISEDDKTLSISNNDLNKISNDDTDHEEDKHNVDDDVIETENVEQANPKFVVTDSDRFLKRSLSESDENHSVVDLEPRMSRSKAKTHERNYESTQSVDRNGNNEKRSVFYLDPIDWIRTEGSSPLPIKEKSPSKILESVTGGLKNNLEILTESEENLNSEIEKINSKPLQPRDLSELRNHSLPNFRLQTPVPAIELSVTREDNGTPDQGYSSTLSFRAITPGANLVEKTRRTTFPLLCSRPGSACDKMMRKKSCVSAEDIHFLQNQSRDTQGSSISGLVRKGSKKEKISDFGEEHLRQSVSSLNGRFRFAG